MPKLQNCKNQTLTPHDKKPLFETTRIDLTLNLKTTKALGIEVPPALLVRADEMIE